MLITRDQYFSQTNTSFVFLLSCATDAAEKYCSPGSKKDNPLLDRRLEGTSVGLKVSMAEKKKENFVHFIDESGFTHFWSFVHVIRTWERPAMPMRPCRFGSMTRL